VFAANLEIGDMREHQIFFSTRDLCLASIPLYSHAAMPFTAYFSAAVIKRCQA